MNKPMFTEDFLYFLKKFGQPFTSTPVEEATLNKYRGRKIREGIHVGVGENNEKNNLGFD